LPACSVPPRLVLICVHIHPAHHLRRYFASHS
jgi:hypothetical protein